MRTPPLSAEAPLLGGLPLLTAHAARARPAWLDALSGARLLRLDDRGAAERRCPREKLVEPAEDVERLLSSRRAVCVGSRSRITCAGHPELRGCALENATVDFSLIGEFEADNKRRPRPGFISADCELNVTAGEFQNMAARKEDHTAFLWDGLRVGASAGLDCEYVVDSPVFIMDHDQPPNVFHSTARALSLFETVVLSGVRPSEAIMMETSRDLTCKGGKNWRGDRVPPFECAGPTFPVYARWFKGAMRAQDVQHFLGDRVCFRRLIPVDPKGVNLLWSGFYERKRDWCESTVLQSMANFSLSHFGIERSNHSKAEIVATLVVRRSTRKFYNEKEVIDAMQELVRPPHRLKIVDLAELSFVEQLQLMASTNILVGMHGAGLANCIYMPRGGVLVELHPLRGNGATDTFRQIAQRAGLKYFDWYNKDERGHWSTSYLDRNANALATRIDITELSAVVKRALESGLKALP